MRKSQAIKLVLLGGGMLAVSTCCVCGGCFGEPDEAPAQPIPDDTDRDPQWYDEHRKPIPEEYTTDDANNIVPVGDPRDRHGRPLQFDEHGNRIFAAAAGAAVGAAAANYGSRRSGSWFPYFWGGSRSGGSYRSPPSSGGTYYGGSRPSTGGSTTSRPSTGGSTTHGGFGGGGSASS